VFKFRLIFKGLNLKYPNIRFIFVPLLPEKQRYPESLICKSV